MNRLLAITGVGGSISCKVEDTLSSLSWILVGEMLRFEDATRRLGLRKSDLTTIARVLPPVSLALTLRLTFLSFSLGLMS
jgi:hypothetical protein